MAIIEIQFHKLKEEFLYTPFSINEPHLLKHLLTDALLSFNTRKMNIQLLNDKGFNPSYKCPICYNTYTPIEKDAICKAHKELFRQTKSITTRAIINCITTDIKANDIIVVTKKKQKDNDVIKVYLCAWIYKDENTILNFDHIAGETKIEYTQTVYNLEELKSFYAQSKMLCSLLTLTLRLNTETLNKITESNPDIRCKIKDNNDNDNDNDNKEENYSFTILSFKNNKLYLGKIENFGKIKNFHKHQLYKLKEFFNEENYSEKIPIVNNVNFKN
jgi:hypothetical protein